MSRFGRGRTGAWPMRICRWPLLACRLLVPAGALWVTSLGTASLAVDPRGEPRFVTDKAFVQALEKRLSATWEQVDLRTITRRLEETQHVALLVDRRFDPSRPMNLSAREVTLAELLQDLAGQRGGQARVVGNAVYLGPESATGLLRTLVAIRVEELTRGEPTSHKRKGLLKPIPFEWPDLTTPRELLDRLGREQAFRIVGADLVPHDLWAAGAFPRGTVPEILSAILIQFDLTFEWLDGGAGIEIVPAPAVATIEKPHSPPKGTSAKVWLVKLQEEFPELGSRVAGNALIVRGTQEQHEAIEQWKSAGKTGGKSTGREGTPDATVRSAKSNDGGKSGAGGKSKRGSKAPEVRYTLRMQDKPLGSLLKTLERPEHGSWQFEYDASRLATQGAPLDRRITFDVREVTFSELLTAALDPLGVTFEIDGKTVRLTPR